MGATGPGGGMPLDRNTSNQAAKNIDDDALWADFNKMGDEAAAAGGGNQELKSQIEAMFPKNDSMKYIGTNIGETFSSPLMPRDSFMNLLGQWQNGIPVQSLWACVFRIPEKVSTATMDKWGEYVGAEKSLTGSTGKLLGSVDNARHYFGITDKNNQGNGFMHGKYGKGALGCMFAQTVGLPVEQSAISTVGPSNRGFIKGPIMEQRQSFAPVNIEFLETNVSFNEFVLRPWAIMCQHEGLIARNWNAEFPGQHDPKERVTTDMMVINYAKAGASATHGGANYRSTRGMVPRKMWFFTDCFPVNIGQERYSYTPDSSPDRRDTEWNFRKYEVILPPQYTKYMHDHQVTDGGEGQEQSGISEKFWKQHKKDFKSSRKQAGGFFGLFG